MNNSKKNVNLEQRNLEQRYGIGCIFLYKTLILPE